jgi:hypothetical protein
VALGFRLAQDVYTVQNRLALLNNSLTFKVGDLIIPTATGGIVTNASNAIAGDFYPLGLIVGFAKQNGEVIGQGTAQTAANTPALLLTAADNTTVDKYQAQYIPLTEDMLLKGTLSAVAGTTGGLSDEKFVYFDLVDCRTVNEASVVANTNATPLQLLSEGLDPLDTTNFTVIVRLVKNLQNRP